MPPVDKLLRCHGCNVLVHISCYGKDRSLKFQCLPKDPEWVKFLQQNQIILKENHSYLPNLCERCQNLIKKVGALINKQDKRLNTDFNLKRAKEATQTIKCKFCQDYQGAIVSVNFEQTSQMAQKRMSQVNRKIDWVHVTCINYIDSIWFMEDSLNRNVV